MHNQKVQGTVATPFAPPGTTFKTQARWPRLLLQSVLVTCALVVAGVAVSTAYIALLIGDASGSMCCLNGDFRPLGVVALLIGGAALRGGYLAAFWKRPTLVRWLSGEPAPTRGYDYLRR